MQDICMEHSASPRTAIYTQMSYPISQPRNVIYYFIYKFISSYESIQLAKFDSPLESKEILWTSMEKLIDFYRLLSTSSSRVPELFLIFNLHIASAILYFESLIVKS